MFPRSKSSIVCALFQLQFPPKIFKSGLPQIRGYPTDCSTIADVVYPVHTATCAWSENILPYQLCSALSNQRHKRYLINSSSSMLEDGISRDFLRLMSKTETSKGGPVKESGGRLGRLDGAGEAGMFHRVNKSKLEQLKKTLKDKTNEKGSTVDPAAKTEE